MNNINNIMTMCQQLQANPAQFLSKRFNVPQELNNPTDIIQHLLNSGQVSQAQVNQVMALRNNPMIKQMFGI